MNKKAFITILRKHLTKSIFVGLLVLSALAIVPQFSSASADCDKDATCRQRNGSNAGDARFCRNPGGNNSECQQCLNNDSSMCQSGYTCQSGVCIAPTAVPPTAVPPTAIVTITAAPPTAVPSTASTAPTVTTVPSSPPITGAPGQVLIQTDANGVATITFKKSETSTGEVKSFVNAGFNAEGIYLASNCSAAATYTPPAPELTLTANPESVKTGQTSTLTWTTKNVTECTASDSWTGTRSSTGGTESTGALTEQKTYTLTCKGPGGEIAKNVTIDVAAPDAPTLTFTGNPTNVAPGGSSTLTWTATNVTGCTASNGWTGTKAATGTESTGPLSAEKTYALKCMGNNGTEVEESVTITVGEAGSATILNLQVLLHGIGAAGDNVVLTPAPCARPLSGSSSANVCLSNQSPKHPIRFVKVEIIDQNNATIKTSNGTIGYDDALGGFKGSVSLGNSWTTGPYTVKVTTPTYLRRQVPGTHTITANTTNTIPVFDMVAGDVNNNNRLEILDYYLILDCYTIPGLPHVCSNASESSSPSFLTDGVYTHIDEEVLKTRAWRVDVDDNGENDLFDENLFRREMIVQHGQ